MFYLVTTFWFITAWIMFLYGNANPECLEQLNQYPILAGFLGTYFLIGNYICGFICLWRSSRTYGTKEYFGWDKPLKWYWARHLYRVYRLVGK